MLRPKQLYFAVPFYASRKNGIILDLKTIWKEQKVSDELNNVVMQVADKLYSVLFGVSKGEKNLGT